jgi:class 3 adenylate cyclase
MSLVENTWKDYKIAICSTLSAAAASLGIGYFLPEIKGAVEHATLIGLPTITSLVLGAIADKNRKEKDILKKRNDELEKILNSNDQFHKTAAISIKSGGTVLRFFPGKDKIFDKINYDNRIRITPKMNIKDKYHEFNPEVAEFFEIGRKDIIFRRDEAKKDPSTWKKFNSKKAYESDDPKTGRRIFMEKNFGNDIIQTTYTFEAFLGQDNETVEFKFRTDAVTTGLEALSVWADNKVVEHIRRDPEAYKTPSKVPTACLYCDIRDSTRFSDTHTGEEVREFINRYYTSLLSAASEFDFSFDKFVGDEILILFGPPYDEAKEHSSMKTPVYNAINAAIKMREAFQDIKGEYDIGLGIGIDFGTPHVGIYGGGKRKQFTGMGKTFNQGARVCSAAEDKEILITDFAYEQLLKEKELVDIKGIEALLEDGGSINAKGVSEPIKIYKVRM